VAKVTSKLQVTIPKVVAARYDIAPGDEIEFEPAGDVIRVVPPRRPAARDIPTRLELFDQASARQRARDRTLRPASAGTRGWTREELYDRDRSR
jgi:AbrB family looped-hinge helix DNA binding protein